MSEEVWDKTIKPLRERAGVKSIYPTAADPYMVEYFQNQVTDPFILEVRRERGIELTMENSRYQDIIRWHQGELFARPWKGVWISAVDTPLDLNADGTPETIVTANPKLQSTLNILMIDGASEAGHKLSRGTSGNICLLYTSSRSFRPRFMKSSGRRLPRCRPKRAASSR